jgi:hypothetical protein
MRSSNRVLGIFDTLNVPSTHHFKFTQRVNGISSFLLTFFFLTVTSFSHPPPPFLQAPSVFFFSSFWSFVFLMCFQQFFLSVVVLPLYNALNSLLCFALFCEFCTLTPSNTLQVLLFWALCTNSKLSALAILFSWALCIDSKWHSRGSSPLSFVH